MNDTQALPLPRTVIAHRGASADAPENTLAAFAAARDRGARWIETDVKLSSDGVPIIMHDDTLERTTNGSGPVADHSWHELQRLDAGGWFGPAFQGEAIPTLAQTLAFARGANMRLNLELKPCPGRTQATTMVTLIEAAKLWPAEAPPILISSFDIDALIIASRLHPDWPRGLLLDTWRPDWRDLAAQTQASAIHVNAELATPAHIQAFADAGFPTLAYTVNDTATADRLWQAGTRAVFSDKPGSLIA